MKKSIIIVMVFIIGCILEEVEIEPILRNMEKEIIELNLLSIIGLLSSITTLLVFLMYLVGKIYSIKRAEMFLTESFFCKA